MVDSFNRQVLRVAVAQICQSMGWDALQKSTHDTLTDVMQRYVEEIGKVAYSYTQLCNRTKPNLDDLHLAFQDTGVVLQELENFVAQVDPLQFIHPFTTYPKCPPCRLQHPSKGEIVDRAEFYSEHLPPLPKNYQEPTDEKEENPSTENVNYASAEETEKIKSTPLKESSNVMETGDNGALKRHYEGSALFRRDHKRSRLDMPANLILEKKENIENTDGESLSPATPVSPYLPQDLPKIPEEPTNPPSLPKVKTEEKQLPILKKEMTLPLQKLTPPEKKTKVEISSSPKKPKVKKEKSISPSVANIVASPSPKSELSSPVRKLSHTKQSPSSKMKSPSNVKSPMVEKQMIKKSSNKSNENKAPSFGSKVSPSKELSSKATPTKKSPSIVVAKKDVVSPKVKEREFKPLKKKKKISEEVDKGKSLNDSNKTTSSGSTGTPKLMIKLLPKFDERVESSKSSPVEQKISTSPVKVKTTSSSPSIKALSLKPVRSGSEINVKSEKKLKMSSESSDIAQLKKEHSKKKKKKKDKDKDKDKEKSVHKEKRKSDKIDPPIPKIRFKLDSSGETKTGETTTSSSKSAASSSQSTSKKPSMIVIETENVRSSIIIETLSDPLVSKLWKHPTPRNILSEILYSSAARVISTKNVLARAYKKFQRARHAEIYLLTLKEHDKTKIELPLDMDYDPDRAYFCPVCHKQDDGSPMVGCDGCDEWCHWSCVGLMAAPPEDEKWYCPLCLLKKDKTKKGKGKKKS